MISTNIHKKQAESNSGFALLITLVIVGVILAIGLSLLDITVKQITLSSTARDSEVSFHAANAGLECALATWLAADYSTDGAAPLTFNCVDVSGITLNASQSDGGLTHEYTGAQFTWNNGLQNLCTEVDLYIMDARTEVGGYTRNFSNQGIANKQCDEGNVCAVIFSRGYNRACNSLNSLRTVQRELTIDF